MLALAFSAIIVIAAPRWTRSTARSRESARGRKRVSVVAKPDQFDPARMIVRLPSRQRSLLKPRWTLPYRSPRKRALRPPRRIAVRTPIRSMPIAMAPIAIPADLSLKAEGKPESPFDGRHFRAREDGEPLFERILGYRCDRVEIDDTFTRHPVFRTKCHLDRNASNAGCDRRDRDEPANLIGSSRDRRITGRRPAGLGSSAHQISPCFTPRARPRGSWQTRLAPPPLRRTSPGAWSSRARSARPHARR